MIPNDPCGLALMMSKGCAVTLMTVNDGAFRKCHVRCS